ncbi:MAG: sodium/solute symporter [Candidatus Hydrogenedentes bacterium]|nr:sodium/solute symporter [Candidatus Hydrogenedentota bacterium]
MNPQFSVFDWTIVAGYMAAVLVIGAWISGRQTDSRYFFLGGRSVPAWAVACSAIATAISAATFIGVPQIAFEGDLSYLITYVGSVIAAFIIAFLFVPPLYNAGTITIYGYLGQRFGTGAKSAAGLMFLFGRLLSSGARLFMAAIGFSMMLSGNVTRNELIFAVIILGVVGTVYTFFGGIRAVIWTDVLQLIVFTAAGLFTLIFLYQLIPASGSDIWAALQNSEGTDKLRIVNSSFTLENPFTLWSGLFAMTIVAVSTHGVDQDMLQRVMTAKSPWHGGLALINSMIFTIPIVLLFLVIGLLLYVFYQRPDLMGAAAPQDIIEDTRRVFPQFVLHHLPTGMRGLTMAGLFAAAMSTFDSAITAMASCLVADIYAPFFCKQNPDSPLEKTEALPDLKASRLAVGIMGVCLTFFAIGAIYMQEKGGQTLIDFALGVMAFALAPLLGVFCVALFTKRGNTKSVYAALVVGIVAVLLLQPYMLPKMMGFKIAWTWLWVIVSPLCAFICFIGAPLNRQKGDSL